LVAQFDGEAGVCSQHGECAVHRRSSLSGVAQHGAHRDWQRRFLALPRSHRELLADEARAGSRRHISAHGTLHHGRQCRCGGRGVSGRPGAAHIHGHTHRPGMHEVQTDGGLAQRIVLGAWYEQGSYLSCERGNYQLRELAAPIVSGLDSRAGARRAQFCDRGVLPSGGRRARSAVHPVVHSLQRLETSSAATPTAPG